MATDFNEMLVNTNPQLSLFDEFKTLQVNLGNRCNQNCKHCHVQAEPGGQKVMSREVMSKIIDFLRKHLGLVVDLTGGCPELNSDFKFFIENVCHLAQRAMVRTNLTVFFEAGLDWVPKWYCEHEVVLIASLPCYTDNVDEQRGKGVFEKSIAALKILNGLGYGIDEQLELNLVYNPNGEFLPGSQEQLEADYKRELYKKYGVKFNRLFTITNAPIGRFKQYLEVNGQLESYLELLKENFNSEAAGNIMCRNLISIDYMGIVYNCDFNQALGLAVIDATGNDLTIDGLDDVLKGGLKIITGNHCFCCTAGAGSSCTGSLVT